MERNLILNEFLSLRKLLNQGNKLANEVTQFRFEIELTSESEYRLLAVVSGQQDRNVIELARRDQFGNWERSGFTKFKRLENFCSKFFNDSEKIRTKLDNVGFVTSDIDFRILCLQLQKIFDDGLINYSF